MRWRLLPVVAVHAFRRRSHLRALTSVLTHTHTRAAVAQSGTFAPRCSVSLLISESCILPLMLSAYPGPFYPLLSLQGRRCVGAHSFKKHTYLLTSVATSQRTIKPLAAGKTPVSDLSRLVWAEEAAAGRDRARQQQGSEGPGHFIQSRDCEPATWGGVRQHPVEDALTDPSFKRSHADLWHPKVNNYAL